MELWNGTFNRMGAWAFYVLANICAIYFNACLIISVFRLKSKKTSTDVLIGGLASGIVVSGIGCGPQCLFSMIKEDFAFGDNACFMEAFLHIVGMIIQFLSVAAIAYRTYVGVVKGAQFKIGTAYVIVAAVWCVGFAGTLLFGSFSPIYLVASGTFCFYDWSSLALIAWAWPVAGTAAVMMGYWYYRTFKTVAAVRHGAKEILVDGSKRNTDLIIRLSAMVFFFAFGYSGLVAQSLYEVTVGRAAIWGDVTAAVLVLTYWISAPFAYALVNHRLRLKSVLFASPHGIETTGPERGALTKIDSARGKSSRSGTPLVLVAVESETTTQAPNPVTSTVLPDLPAPPSFVNGRGMNRLEGSPSNSGGRVFSFDNYRQSMISTVETTDTDPSPLTNSEAPSPRSRVDGLEMSSSRQLMIPQMIPQNSKLDLSPSFHNNYLGFSQLNSSGVFIPAGGSALTPSTSTEVFNITTTPPLLDGSNDNTPLQ